MSLPAYKIEHVKAHRDLQDHYRAETLITIAERYKVRVLTKIRQDGFCRTTARCTRFENAFEGDKDFYKELRAVDGAAIRSTRNAINVQHFAAVFDLRPLVIEVARFYGLTKD